MDAAAVLESVKDQQGQWDERADQISEYFETVDGSLQTYFAGRTAHLNAIADFMEQSNHIYRQAQSKKQSLLESRFSMIQREIKKILIKKISQTKKSGDAIGSAKSAPFLDLHAAFKTLSVFHVAETLSSSIKQHDFVVTKPHIHPTTEIPANAEIPSGHKPLSYDDSGIKPWVSHMSFYHIPRDPTTVKEIQFTHVDAKEISREKASSASQYHANPFVSVASESESDIHFQARRMAVQDPLQYSIDGPCGLTIDPLTGDVYVVGWREHRMYQLTSDMHGIAAYGSNGPHPGQFYYPRGIAFSVCGRWIYVADEENNRVQCFDRAWVFQWSYHFNHGKGLLSVKDKTLKASDFTLLRDRSSGEPWCIATEEFGYVYVTTPNIRSFHRLSRDGQLLATYQSPETIEDFRQPFGICVTNDNFIAVASQRGGTVVFLDQQLNHHHQFTFPKARDWVSLGRGPKDTILVSDEENAVVHVIRTNGEIVSSVSVNSRPVGAVFGLDGRLYVSNFSKCTICVV